MALYTDLTMTETGKVAPWSAIRAYILKRDEHLCQICMVASASEVDHVWPQSLGGDNASWNLQAACSPCNKAKGDRVDFLSASPDHRFAAISAIGKRMEALAGQVDDIVRIELARRISAGESLERVEWEVEDLLVAVRRAGPNLNSSTRSLRRSLPCPDPLAPTIARSAA